MCRIFGHFNAAVPPAELRAVGALQRHGGPDATGTACGPGWGVGANRLAVVDLAGGEQPYRDGDGITVVFNGEIYNHDVLRRRLEARGDVFPDRCDGTVLPALYATHGPDFVELLDGMFALAVVDHREERPLLVLATDGAGMKPLYVHHDPAARSLHFSSELPALLGFRAVPDDLWLPGLDAVLAGRTPFGGRTAFRGIEAVEPGTTLVCRFGEPPRTVRRAPARLPAATDLDVAADDVRDVLRAEVGRLLVADVPVAVITSGGLDSGLVTALAAERGPIDAFTVGFRGTWPMDERHHARAVADATGAVLHQVEIDPVDLPDVLQDVVRHLGQPNTDPITASTHALFAAVRRAGFTVALSGDGADEVFGGYDRMREAAAAAATGADWCSAYLDAIAVLPAADRAGLYTGEYRRALHGTEPLPAAAVEELRHGAGTPLARITEFELTQRLPAYHLRRVDHLSMASSVEVRVPFCQPAVVARGRALPDELRVRGEQVKRTLYAAAEGLVPRSVLDRPKQPFTLPVAALLRPGTPLWARARDVLHPAALRAGGQLAPAAVEALFARQAAAPDGRAATALWALLVHELWRSTLTRGATTTASGAVAA